MATMKNVLITTSLNQIYGENLNKRFELKGPEVLIGRSPFAGIKLICPNVSRKHCTLKESSDGWTIIDNESQNGTYVNGVQLKPKVPSLLQCGDIIFLGPPSEIPQAFCVEVDYKYRDSEEAKESEPQQIEEILKEKSIDKDVAVVLEKEVREDNKSDSCTPSIKTRPKRKALSSLTAVQSSKIPPKKIKITTEVTPICEIDKSVIECDQVNEISSTENQEMDDSLSLLDIQKEIESCALSSTDINKPSCSHDDPSLEKDETAILKLKLAALTNKVKKLTEAKHVIIKNYKDVKKQNKALDEQLAEQEKLKESLQNCELRAKNEVKKELFETFGEDLICIICSELLIKPSVLDCSHTFCEHCIKVWKKTKNECPMCRKRIETVTRVLTLDNFIDKTVEKLTPEQRDVREKLIKEREELEAAKKASPKPKKRPRRNPRNNRSQNRSRDSVEIIGENDVFPIGLPTLPFPLFLNNTNFRVSAAVRRSMEALNNFLI